MINKSMGLITKVISIIMSIFFIGMGIFFFVKFDPDAYDMKVSGTIVEINQHYELIGGDNELVCTAYVDYQADKTLYKHVAYPEYNSKMKVGDVLEFYCMSEDPTMITGPGKDKAPYIGLAFAAVGLILLAGTVIAIIRK